ncbi:ATP-NAD kinase-like domain-containing protein [Gamsiella multidivaricata]|uniref:ATP-NAD kinase-like domain-containing protein n=1 Tax=Gamsiella multidivaricata TaxID=101098 RepID=UPI00221EF186|nr:ATP-NAD kinase-like domain-containing protein [Gamsiella multidivaricata]KAG0367974.1 hypothetical protein BGZ54_002919 [Gamsiella multidivaricata]KAI7821543.1 ATP-NAD kinase-like domain-containing protein [Gamsiella multidivaricata]
MGILPTSDKFPLLVVLNPSAGLKQGQKIFAKTVQPAIDNSGTAVRLIETSARGFAQTYFKDNIQQILADLCQSLVTTASNRGGPQPVHPTSATLRVMVMGGDGTVHETVNGILEGLKGSSFVSDGFRPKIELSVVPTGTGNAIATSLGVTTVQEAIERFQAGAVIPLRVVKVSTRPQESNDQPAAANGWKTHVYTVVVNSFGLHCATVHDAEGYRGLGNLRFKIAALKNIFLLKQYEARLDFYGPVQRYDRPLQKLVATVESDTEEVPNASSNSPSFTLSGPFTYLMFSKQASLEPGFKPTPLAKTSDGWLDVLAVQNVGRSAILQVLEGIINDGQHVQHEKVEYYKAKIVELETPKNGRLCIDGEFMDIAAGPQGRVKFEVSSDPNIQLFHVYS